MKTMRQYLFFAVAILLMASCSDSSFVGDKSLAGQEGGKGAIAFGFDLQNATRSGDKTGAEAAKLLNNRFVVSGFKTTNGTTYSQVFDNYGVEWTDNSAGTTGSNTSDWEYVGKTKSPVSGASSQTIKYWDYASSSYDFIAYSTGAATAVGTDGEIPAGKVKVDAIDHANKATTAFTLSGSVDDLAGCYIADLVTVSKTNYDKEVQLTFRSLSSKVRIGLYETIPGYKVKNVKFYQAHPTTLGTGSGTTPYLIGSFAASTSFVVSYNGSTAQVTPGNATNVANKSFGSFPAGVIGTSSSAPTFAGTAPYYQTVMPNAGTGALELAVDYTLESEDGSGEIINIYGATAHVPAAYTKWLPNYAYTYIFKISDNTNGWTSTSTTDPAGLYPITFDAVVLTTEQAGQQSTITQVARPSITTYQKGHDYTNGPEYAASGTNPIYVQVMVDGTLKGDLNTKGQLYTLSADKSEAEVLNALSIQTAKNETTITGRNGLTLTKAASDATITAIPGVDGNEITVTAGKAASFAATTGSYAYVYDTGEWDGIAVTLTEQPAGWPTGYYTDKKCTDNTAASTFTSDVTYYKKESYIYSAETMTATAPDDWTTHDLWYQDPNGETTVGAWDAANEDKVFYKRYTVDHKIYGVKVIKVVNP